MRKALLGSLFFSFFLFAFDPASPASIATEIESQKTQLEETKRKLSEIEERIKKLTQEEKGTLKRISAVEEKISVTRRYIQQLANLINLKEKEIARVKREIANTQTKIARTKKNLSQIMFLFYKITRLIPLEFYLTAKTLPEVYRKVINLRYIARESKSNIESLSQLQKELEAKEKSLLSAYKELARIQTEKKREETSLKETKDLERKILSRVQREKANQEKLERDLRAAKAKLENLISELEKKREARRLAPGAHFFEVMKGSLPWPYKGKVVSSFGSQFHPKYKTRTKNTGIDIECPVGAGVRVIGKGRVVYAGRFLGYGNMVIVDHREGYYTIYSDLSEITVGVGQELAKGEVLGKANETIHFEIRKEGRPVNPLEWLAR